MWKLPDLLPVFARNIPKWNLSLVLHRLTQPPFEPQKEAAFKFLTWKVIFLLALASGKRHSETQAWTLDGLLCPGYWEHPIITLSFIHCQESTSKRRSAINLSSGHSSLEVLSRLTGYRYSTMPCQGTQMLSGLNQGIKSG